MRRVRTRLTGFGLLTAAVFAAAIALPGPALYQHQHHDGDRALVHDDGEGLLAERLEHHHHTHDGLDHDHAPSSHLHRSAARDGGPKIAGVALQHDDQPAGTHWHEQQRSHRAVFAAAPFLTTVSAAGVAAEQAPAPSTRVVALDLHARAPPHAPHC